MSRKPLALGALLVFALVVGCAPTPDVSSCQAAPGELIAGIAKRVTVPGALRHGYVSSSSSSPGWVFISAELHRVSDNEHKLGKVLTWAAPAEAGALGAPVAGFRAVDQNARKQSSWPAAVFDVRKAGVVSSRACAASNRGSTSKQSAG